MLTSRRVGYPICEYGHFYVHWKVNTRLHYEKLVKPYMTNHTSELSRAYPYTYTTLSPPFSSLPFLSLFFPMFILCHVLYLH